MCCVGGEGVVLEGLLPSSQREGQGTGHGCAETTQRPQKAPRWPGLGRMRKGDLEEASEVDCLLCQSESCTCREMGLRLGLGQAVLSPFIEAALLLAQQIQAGGVGAPGKVLLPHPALASHTLL